MMFEKQCKSGVEPFKVSSSAIGNPFGVSSDTMKDSLTKNESELSKTDHCRSGPDQANGSTTVEESSLQDTSKAQASDDLKQNDNEDTAQPPKRPRTDE
ncbi:unnamed protein product [Trifolium pratense]|uniref:Uncharacterized protein n=1 Tax=Trifolium pratense TaxID=57577 RepID=A0ACB0ILX3_TRIPR|nr:unnamed protein product [Trifolium pratense]